MFTYFPMLLNMKITLLSWPRFIRLRLVASLPSARFKMACSKPWGAISMQIALAGTCWRPSENRTDDSKLLTWYAAEDCWASCVFQPSSGILVLIQRGERFFGLGIILSRDLRNFGAASAIYRLWKAMFEDFTPLANIPSAFNSAMNFDTESTGPEI